MGRYLCLWELDRAALPKDTRGWNEWENLVQWVRQQVDSGFITDWGEFIGELSGFALLDGSEQDVNTMVRRFITLASLKIRPIASADEVGELIRALAGSTE